MSGFVLLAVGVGVVFAHFGCSLERCIRGTIVKILRMLCLRGIVTALYRSHIQVMIAGGVQ